MALAAVLCGVAWILPAAAWANSGQDSPVGSTVKHSNGNSATMKVDALRGLDYTLYPDDHIEQTVDPALRVTITGKEWRLYAVWDGGPASSMAYIRADGGWTRLSAGQVLIASSAAVALEKHAEKSRTTVIELALRLRIGADGTDPWSVRPGTYPGRLRLRLEGSAACDPDEPGVPDSGDLRAAPAEPATATSDSSPAMESSIPAIPSAPPEVVDGNAETSASADASASTSTVKPVFADSLAVDDPDSGTAVDEGTAADPSVETSSTIPAAGESGESASEPLAPGSKPAEREPSHAKSRTGAPIELSTPPDPPSVEPTDAVVPAEATDPPSR